MMVVMNVVVVMCLRAGLCVCIFVYVLMYICACVWSLCERKRA